MTAKNMLCFKEERFHRINVRQNLLSAGITVALLFAGTAYAGAGAEWTLAGGTPEGTRFSDLTDITPANVAQLKEEFAFKTDTHTI